MIEKIGVSTLLSSNSNLKSEKKSPMVHANAVSTPSKMNSYSSLNLVNALHAYNGIQNAKSITFGKSLHEALERLNTVMSTCRDLSKGMNGESVGSRISVSDIIETYSNDLPKENDAIKTDIVIKTYKSDKNQPKDDMIIDSRTQVKKTKEGNLYQMAVRQPRKIGTMPNKTIPLSQIIDVCQDPYTNERAYVLDTKGKLMVIMEDIKNDNVFLTNTGSIVKKDKTPGQRLTINVEQAGNTFRPFSTSIQKVEERFPEPSIGEGTEIVIGMEDGRFVPEIIDSIQTFAEKINSGEIVLKQFVANPNAKNTQLAMLAGGFGSRAEYTNASSDGIFHGSPNGAQSTKGVFRTATGLTPMETTFISLHNAGLLDCSKGKFEIGKNIKFYLNQSGVNKGNGGFTVDLYNKMEREGRNSLTLFPNDSMSRMSVASKKMADIMNSGNAAIVMIAKEVKSEDARGNFGIMKLGKDNEILEFAEKPEVIPSGYEKDGKCLTNTFQFSVSKEVFKALSLLEPYFPAGKGKEPRDWSKTFVPIVMSLTQKNNIYEITADIAKIVDAGPGQIPKTVVEEAKNILGNQKIIAVPTDEPWADCGTLNALYHTTMQIANNDFKLEDFERKHVLDSINTRTGLVASSPEQKADVESKYFIDGQVMVVPKAKKVDPEIVDKYIDAGFITINEKQ